MLTRYSNLQAAKKILVHPKCAINLGGKPIRDRAERHDLKSQLWLFFSLLKKERRRKGE